jgi:uncharacterized protein YndB with AHSA1/START domain
MAKKFKYDWSEFTLKAAYNASPAKLFKLWTKENELCKWFLVSAKMELRKGGEYEWEWMMGAREKGKVLAVKKNSLFRFTFAGGICEVKFRRAGKGCLVILRQYDIPIDEKHKVGTHLSCSIGWTFFLTNLKSYIETGVDLREYDQKHLKEGTVFY